jgi:hypothetical protein
MPKGTLEVPSARNRLEPATILLGTGRECVYMSGCPSEFDASLDSEYISKLLQGPMAIGVKS